MRHGQPWAPMNLRCKTELGLGGTCGQPQTGRHQTARQQRAGNDPLQVVGGVHVVFPLFWRRLVGVVALHKGRFATDPNNIEYYSCRLLLGFPGPTTESDEGLNGFLTTRPGRVLLVDPHTRRATKQAATGV